MKTFSSLLALLLLVAYSAFAQSNVPGDRVWLGTTDASNSTHSMPFRTVTSLPFTCVQYEWMYQPIIGNTGILYYCPATNVLVQFSAGGGGGGGGGTSYPVMGPGVTTPGVISPTDYSSFVSKQDALGFIPENTSTQDKAGGYPSLDANGNVPVSELGNVGSAGFQATSFFDLAGAATNAVATLPLSGITQTQPALITQPDWVTFNGKQDALKYTAEDSANKARPNGYAGLDVDGLVPINQLPDVVKNVFISGTAQTAAPNFNIIPSGTISISSVYNPTTDANDVTFFSSGSGGGGSAGLTGTVTPAWTPILDGACESQNFTLSGIATNDSILPGWPGSQPTGIIGIMNASATNTVTVQLCNLTGSTFTPTGLYTATRVGGGTGGSGTGTSYTFGQGLVLSGTLVSVNATGNGAKVVTASTLSGASNTAVCTDATGLNITTSNCPSGSGSGGLPDPGANGIVKRTALNADAVAVAGTDYYKPGTAIRATDVPNNAANTTGSSASLQGIGPFQLYGATTDTSPASLMSPGQLGIWFSTANQNLNLVDRSNNTSSLIRLLTNGVSTNCANSGDFISGFTLAGVPICTRPSVTGNGFGNVTITGTSGGSGAIETVLANPASAPNGSYTGLNITAQVQSGNVQNWGTTALIGSTFNTDYFGTTTIPNVYGPLSTVTNRSTGTITSARAFYGLVKNQGAGTITNAYGMHIPAMINSGGGSIGTTYGLKIDQTTVGTTNWSLYVTNGDVFFGGTVNVKLIQSGTTANTDLDGLITMTGGSGTYTFTGGYATPPICVANDTQSPSAVQVGATTTTLTLTGVSGHQATYICHGRT